MIHLLFLLNLKHFIIDFVLQTEQQVKYKGIFGHPVGFSHSFEHGIWTSAILCFYINLEYALLIGYCEAIIHYLTDYCKMRYGCRDLTNKKFWAHLGLDQLIHQITYLGIIKVLDLCGIF